MGLCHKHNNAHQYGIELIRMDTLDYRKELNDGLR